MPPGLTGCSKHDLIPDAGSGTKSVPEVSETTRESLRPGSGAVVSASIVTESQIRNKPDAVGRLETLKIAKQHSNR